MGLSFFSQINPADFGFVLFFIFVGAGYQLFVRPNSENLGVTARVYSQFTAVILIGALAALAMIQTKYIVHPIVVGIGGLLATQGGAKVLRLVAEFFDKQNDLLTLVERLGKGLSAFWTTIKTGPNPPDSHD